jgi:type IV pilus assembly protein PilA
MKHLQKFNRQLGQGMTEYIIIVALIAIAAIGVYQAFGTVVKGQTATAAATLAGGKSAGARSATTTAISTADAEGKKLKTLKDFEE